MKEVFALVPVHNPKSEDLQRYNAEIISDLRFLGMKVLNEVTDDNRLNQKFYSLLDSKGTYEYKYSDDDDTAHLIYDSIHIAKNVRNNWLNKKDFRKTFWYPDFDDFSKICNASFVDLRELHKADFSDNKLIRKAYKLNKKTLYPSNFERQRVPLLLNILHPSTISALRVNENIDKTGGTSNFLELWRIWFAIMNNRSITKGRNFYLSTINCWCLVRCVYYVKCSCHKLFVSCTLRLLSKMFL